MHRQDWNFIEMEINNGRIMQLAQDEKDSPILLTTYNEKSGVVDSETLISPADMVMLINYYRQQIENNQPII